MPNDREAAAAEMARLAGSSTSWDERFWRAGDRTLTPAEVVAALTPHLTDERRARIEAVLDGRTYELAVVVDGLVDTGNVAAVMRTADAMGIQPFHIVDTAGSYKHSRRTTQGAEKWLDRWRWRDPRDCVGFLRHFGYSIVVTRRGGDPLAGYDFSTRTALVFGNEVDGVSPQLLGAADAALEIPMTGFARSFNISVAAGICLYAARKGRSGDLPPHDRERLRAVWYQLSVPNPGAVLRAAAAGGSP